MKDLNILVPTDFSELSRRALRAADQWVRLLGGRITPLYAYEGTTDLDGFHFFGPKRTIVGDLTTIEREVRQLLDEFSRQDVDAEHLGESVFIMGNPALTIAKVALEHDLVVISSHGRSGLSRFFLGSVTDKLIRLSPVPILVVADEPALTSLERILVFTDLSSNSEAAFPYARNIARATGASVELLYLHVCDPAEVTATRELEERVRAFAAPHFGELSGQFETSVVVTAGSARDAIHRLAEEKKHNLIITATTGKDGAEHLLLSSTPAQMVRVVHTAVLLVAAEQQKDAAEGAPKPD